MKLHDHICRIVSVFLTLCLVVLADMAAAQDWIGQFPFAPPMASPMVRGRFYFQGGVRYRNLQKLEFSQQGHVINVENLGTPQFGPSQAGDFGTGTGNLPGFTAAKSPWTYDNGSVDATGTFCWQSTCTESDTTTATCSNPPADWPQAPEVQLGRFLTIGSQCTTGTAVTCPAAPPCDPCTEVAGVCVAPSPCEGCQPTPAASCCFTQNLPQNIGAFVISDPVSQVNNTASISGTTRITFQALITDSAIWGAGNDFWKQPEKSYQVWTPTFEVGFQYSNLFDLFYGFSWFGVSRKVFKQFPLIATFNRRGFQDTFSFSSDDSSAWPTATFDSTNTTVGSTSTHNYRIWPDGIGQGLYPHREFFLAADPTVSNVAFTESISHRIDASVYENRWGARSWLPLYGMGRIGAYLGIILSPVYHKETGSRTVVNVNAVANPSPPPDFLLTAGQVLEAQSDMFTGWWFNFGGFVGMDLELGARGWYAKGSVDYALCTDQSFNLLGVETRFNPGGFSAAISGGFHF